MIYNKLDSLHLKLTDIAYFSKKDYELRREIEVIYKAFYICGDKYVQKVVYLAVIFNFSCHIRGFLTIWCLFSYYYYKSNQYIMSHLFLEGSLIIKINEISHVPFPLAKYTVPHT